MEGVNNVLTDRYSRQLQLLALGQAGCGKQCSRAANGGTEEGSKKLEVSIRVADLRSERAARSFLPNARYEESDPTQRELAPNRTRPDQRR